MTSLPSTKSFSGPLLTSDEGQTRVGLTQSDCCLPLQYFLPCFPASTSSPLRNRDLSGSCPARSILLQRPAWEAPCPPLCSFLFILQDAVLAWCLGAFLTLSLGQGHHAVPRDHVYLITLQNLGVPLEDRRLNSPLHTAMIES